MFHARGPAVAKELSPNDDSVRGSETVIDSADLRLDLVPCSSRRGDEIY